MARAIQQRIEVQDRGSAKINRAAQSVKNYGRAWGMTARTTQRAMRLMDRGFARLGRSMRTLTRRAKFMLIGFQLTATIMATSMVRSAVKYERALRNVTSLMAGAGMGQEQIEKNFRRMDGAIRRMAVRLGQAPEDLAAGMYQVVSATFDGTSGLEVLETAAKGALAGLSDTNTVTGLLTKTLQAYRKEGQSNAEVAAMSTDVMDTYFMAVNRGMFTFDELANKMGALPSTASAFGISLQDLMSFLSTATIRGMSLDEAITGVRQAMLSIGKLTPQTEEAAQALFGDQFKDVWSAEALGKNGLYGTLVELNKVLPEIPANVMEAAIAMEDEGGDAFGFIAEQTGKSVEAIAALFPNIRALKAIMAVSGPGMQLYGENMGFMEERAGATGRALEEMEKSGALAMEKFKSVMSVIGLDVGGLVLPVLTNLGNAMVDWYGGLQMRFAEEGGLFDNDDWLAGASDSDAERRQIVAAQEFWDNADPGERLGYTLRTAWSDAMTNLTNWFEGGGREKITAVSRKFGEMIANGLRGLMGISGDDVADSIPAQFGKAMLDGFVSAFEGFDWKSFFQSTFGRAATAVIGGVFAGPGGFVGGAASPTGNPVVDVAGGWAAWNILKKVVSRGAAPAAAGAAGAAGSTGLMASAWGALSTSTFGTAVGVAFLNVAPAIGSAFAAALVPALVLGLGTYMATHGMMDSTPAPFMGSPEATKKMLEDARAAYPDDPWKQLQMINAQPRAALGGMGIDFPASGLDWSDPFGGKVWDDATGTFVDATQEQSETATRNTVASNRYDRAVAKFGSIVNSMPYLLGSISGILSHDNTGGGTTSRTIGGQTASKRGYDGMVYSPTKFLAGEAGPEHVKISPSNAGLGGGSGMNVTVHVHDSGNPKATAAAVVRELEKAVKNG